MPRKVNWKMTLAGTFFLIIFITLGLWQVQRGYEKQAMIQLDEQRRAETGITMSELLLKGPREGQAVVLSGQFDPAIRILKDNVVLGGRVGFELVVPFHSATVDARILINLGFLPLGRTRADLPTMPQIPLQQVQIRGHLYLTKPDPMAPGGHQGVPSQLIVQRIKPPVIGALTGQSYYNHLLRLDQDEPMALPRHWPLVVMLPAQHFGYGLTWFLMALVLLIALSIFTVKARQQGDQ